LETIGAYFVRLWMLKYMFSSFVIRLLILPPPSAYSGIEVPRYELSSSPLTWAQFVQFERIFIFDLWYPSIDIMI